MCSSITAKILVWVAGVLVPVQALPVKACGCGEPLPQSIAMRPDQAADVVIAPAPDDAARLQARQTCCGTPPASEQPRNCCGGGGASCGCGDCPASRGGPCHCSANHSVPAPDPLPGNSQTGNTKYWFGSPSDAIATVVKVVPSVVLSQAAQQSSLRGSTSLERLTTLCRLVI